MPKVLYDVSPDGYAVITINRPDKLNAISLSVVSKLNDILDHINVESLKFLIITGAGSRSFCAGGDLNDFHGEMSADEAYNLLKPMQEVLYKLATLPIPTIAWMNGLARGGGLEIASACDFRFATNAANYGFIQGQLGISTGWGGGTLLYERIHPQQAFQWMIEADVKDVQELKEIGFIQKIITEETISSQHELLAPFLNRSFDQMTLWKQQRLSKMSLDSLAIQMDNEVKACSQLWVSEEHKEALKQFFNKNNK
ncbi:enoyl-CoA hydratase/isomerase family protein [Filobacillus milosensis]|uniref:Ethylmalonyl-CoA decarboxylase n=1 Tax=Filobacillus milosensis TaxID=94137 RepID=A0A4Y8IRT2_9BACI|nr:enoyl-CoA hydratase/isomerase family protein [Filobacillus milosensis]TFB23312.1 enoyl-CoA hydratase/isomerase family protein [Filobacillus milosensis]